MNLQSILFWRAISPQEKTIELTIRFVRHFVMNTSTGRLDDVSYGSQFFVSEVTERTSLSYQLSLRDWIESLRLISFILVRGQS